MVGQALDAALVWSVVLLLGLGTYGLRVSFIHFHGRMEEFPPRVAAALTYVPPAVMAALIAPALFTLDGTVQGVLNVRVLAAGVAAVVAWRTGSMLATIGVGMGLLWTVTFLLG